MTPSAGACYRSLIAAYDEDKLELVEKLMLVQVQKLLTHQLLLQQKLVLVQVQVLALQDK